MPLEQFQLTSPDSNADLTFRAAGSRFGCIAYQQDGAEVWMLWHPRWGWCLTNSKGEVTGLPLGVPKIDQRHRPPKGAWLQRSGTTSQVYALIWQRIGAQAAA